jgi:hypothetical protein
MKKERIAILWTGPSSLTKDDLYIGKAKKQGTTVEKAENFPASI